MASFPGSNPSDSTLWVAVNIVSDTLDGNINNSVGTVNVLDASSFPSSGYIVIDTEVIKYSGTTAASFTGCTRGADGTSAASHTTGVTVYHNWVADHHNVLKDEIIAIATNLTNRIGGHATQVQFANGTVTNPSASFQNDTDCGQYRIGANNIGFAINGAIATQWTTTGFGTLDGTVTNPGLFFNSDTNVGLYRIGVDNPAMAVNGALCTQWKTTGFGILDGTVTNPGLFFNSDTNSGLYRIGADNIGVSLNGVKQIDIGTSSITFTNEILGQDGTVTNPAYSFSGDTDTGMYRGGSGEISFASNGTVKLVVNSGGVTSINGQLFFADGTVTNPGLCLTTDTDVGFYKNASNTLGFVAGGAMSVRFNTLGLQVLDGAVGDPAISFFNDVDTGMFSIGANNLGFASGGVITIRLDTLADIGGVETAMLLLTNTNGLLRVSTGANGSGGGSNRALIVPNL